MATRNAKTANTDTKSTGRRMGRPTNAERQARVQSQASQFIEIAAAAYAAGMKTALGIDGGVQTLASMPQGIGSGIGIAQGNQSSNDSIASGTTTSAPATVARKQRQAPGRRVDAGSAMSRTRAFYEENLKSANPLVRADFVRAAKDKFGYTQQTANTYVSNIEKAGGYKLDRRGGTGAARGGRSRGNKQATQQVAASA